MSGLPSRSILQAQLGTLLPVAMNDTECWAMSWVDLVRGLGMTGRQIMRLFELAEEACGVTLRVEDMLDWAIGRASLQALGRHRLHRQLGALRARLSAQQLWPGLCRQ